MEAGSNREWVAMEKREASIAAVRLQGAGCIDGEDEGVAEVDALEEGRRFRVAVLHLLDDEDEVGRE
jgi:hypothetical protein